MEALSNDTRPRRENVVLGPAHMDLHLSLGRGDCEQNKNKFRRLYSLLIYGNTAYTREWNRRGLEDLTRLKHIQVQIPGLKQQ